MESTHALSTKVNPERAIENANDALYIAITGRPQDSAQVSSILMRLVDLYQRKGDLESAISYAHTALAVQ